MSDAPRWPGADGSPGLDFSRNPRGANAPEAKKGPSAGSAAPSAGAGHPNPSSASSTPPAAAKPGTAPSGPPADATDTSRIPSVPLRGSTSTTTRPSPSSQRDTVFRQQPQSERPRTQNAEDWELDSITRSDKPVSSSAGNASEPETVTSSRTPGTNASEETRVSPIRAVRRTRKARLRLHRLDPWSVMKTSFLFSIAFAVMFVAAIAVLWSVFAGSDTMVYINDFVNSILADEGGERRFDIGEYLGWERVIGFTTVIGAINVVIFTAVATLFAFLYNLSATIMGGLEVTLAED